MAAPPKPWEQSRHGVQQQMLNSSAPLQMIQNPVGRIQSSGLPQLPPRPGINSYGSNPYSSIMGASSYPRTYNNYGSYGGMAGYGGYGGYGMGYGGMYGGAGGMYRNGYGLGPESRFIQLAEESTRPAFEGIESLVRAFSSISMMLDSTYFAVTSSFRAVLGVAENFGQIRSMFGQVWSSFALLRLLNWIYRKILRLFGVNVVEDLGKEAWTQAVNETGASVANNNVSNWPIFMFLGMIVSAPYFISRLLPPIVDKTNPKNWAEPGRRAVAQYPFQATNAQELSIRPGEEIIIAPKSVQDEMQLSGTGWILAASKTNSFGLVPVNYLQLVGTRQYVAAKTAQPTTINNRSNELPVFPTKTIMNNKKVSVEKNDGSVDAAPLSEFPIPDPGTGSGEAAASVEIQNHSEVITKESLNTAQNYVPATSQTTNSNDLPK